MPDLLNNILTNAFQASGLLDPRVMSTRVRIWISLSQLTSSGSEQSIPGLEKVDISHVALHFPLGGVATAEFMVATGRDVLTRKLAAIHTSIARQEFRLLVRAYASFTGKERPGRSWPAGTFRIWDGVTVGPGFAFSRQSNSYTIHSAHWLMDLDSGTLATQSLVKNAAENLLVAYGMQTAAGSTLASVESAIRAVAVGRPGDVWAQAIVPILKAAMLPTDQGGGISGAIWEKTIAGLNACQSKKFGGRATLELGNARAFGVIDGAVKRFNQEKHLKPGNLTLTPVTYASDRLVQQIAQAVGLRVAQSTLLDKLTFIAQLTMAKLISNVEAASLVQHTPVLADDLRWRTIEPSEYFHVRGQGHSPIDLAGVGIISSEYYSQTSAPTSTEGYVAGAFRASEDGKFALLASPAWLLFQPPAEKLNEQNQKPTTAVSTAGTAAAPGPLPGKTIVDAEMGCRIAKQAWAELAYGGRSASVVGRLRFDVCPGSIVRVNIRSPLGAQAGAVAGQEDGALHGCVNNVDILIDSNEGKAQTTLQLSHLHAPGGDVELPTGHPVYPTETWLGSPLVKLRDEDLQPETS